MNSLDLTLLVVRHALALVFLLAAVGKLRDREATRRAATDLGTPLRTAGVVAIALPTTELCIAAGLLVPATAGIAGGAAVALVSTFTVLVAVQLGRGRRPSCNCFGAGSAPIGTSTVVRNTALLAASAAVTTQWLTTIGETDSACRLGCPSELTAGQVVAITAAALAVIVLAAHTWAIVQLLRQRGELIDRLEGLEARFGGPLLPSHTPAPVPVEPGAGSAGHDAAPGLPGQRGHGGRHHRGHRRGLAIGSPAPRFALADTTGRQVGIDELLAGPDDVPTVLLFLETRCDACVALAAEIGQRRTSERPLADRRLVAVVGGDPTAVAERIDPRGFAHVLVDAGGVVTERYGVVGSPTALVVLSDGRVASSFAEGRASVSRLARGTASASSASSTPSAPITDTTSFLETTR